MLFELLFIFATTWAIYFGLRWAFHKMTNPGDTSEPQKLPLMGEVTHLSTSASDDQILGFVDSWVRLLEEEKYEAAYAHTAHREDIRWSAELIRQTIKTYSHRLPSQRVTHAGQATQMLQRKDVHRFPKPRAGSVGEIWYDLNIDGVTSDLTATFIIFERDDGLAIVLDNIHVM